MSLQGPQKEKRKILRRLAQLQARREHELHERSWTNIADKLDIFLCKSIYVNIYIYILYI